MDVVQRGALGPDRADLFVSEVADWIEAATGHKPNDPGLFARALTHSSRGGPDYERLEFLGDRVLGLAMAQWLLETFPDDPEGGLSDRLHALVAGEVCADIARQIGAPGQLKMGAQALSDGVFDSDNVLGDVVEAIIGALFLDGGLDAASGFVRAAWGDRVRRLSKPPKHPKAQLQEWAAANKRKAPVYEMVDRSGPHHLPRFEVKVTVRGVGEASGCGTSKSEAEKAAAQALLERLS